MLYYKKRLHALHNDDVSVCAHVISNVDNVLYSKYEWKLVALFPQTFIVFFVILKRKKQTLSGGSGIACYINYLHSIATLIVPMQRAWK